MKCGKLWESEIEPWNSRRWFANLKHMCEETNGNAQCNHQGAVQMIDVLQFPSYFFSIAMSDYWKVPGYPSPKFSANPRIKSNTKLWCQCFHISICCSNARILQWLGHHIACWMSCRNLKWATNKKQLWLSFNFNYKVRHIIVIIQVPCFFRLLGSLELPPHPPKK